MMTAVRKMVRIKKIMMMMMLLLVVVVVLVMTVKIATVQHPS